MTNVGLLKECPNCSQQILTSGQKYCTNCGFDLNFRKTSDFGSPDYYYYQVKEAIRAASGVKANAELMGVKSEEINGKYQIHLQHITGEETMAALSDALDVIASVPRRTHTSSELKSIATFGKKIGQIANSLENLYKSIGVFNAELPGKSEFSDDNN